MENRFEVQAIRLRFPILVFVLLVKLFSRQLQTAPRCLLIQLVSRDFRRLVRHQATF
jgi:hypothetical protein